ncbi:hypothetical protein QFC19_002484 [Naganishia cerealis]|uniref:Uncharacterized protein n=1 Tax=Naganishia cerealis TaxID=610337 RepID=A0ACC2WBJ8_9TREE|nr:hypothetical protein QFC19_002484 [Naganishia cerealis]
MAISSPPTSTIGLILPPTESRPHRYIRLENSLECILVHDPACNKAAASMNVGVGHLQDPVNLPGCAHFCRNYPEDNAYSKYLSENGGASNAYTGLSNTNYRFEVAPNALLGALDRFACFFTEPLFNPSCTEREVNAVNSEHNANLQSDVWRFFQLEKHLSSRKHPFSKFGTGTRETLWDKPKQQGRDPTVELADWWKKEYCAKRMKLVVIGREDLDTLESSVRERFEAVPVRTTEVDPRLVYSDNVLEEGQRGIIVFAEPVMDLRGLEITFPFSDLSSSYDTKPGMYLSHALGHGGPGSVLSYLKRRGWVHSLRAAFQRRAPGFDSFKVTLHLTAEGLTKYREVAMSVFKYLALLRNTAPQEYLFDDIKELSALKFRFLESRPSSLYASELSKQMQQPVPREKIISSQILVERFDPDAVRAVLLSLDVTRSVIAVTAKDLPSSVGKLDQTEPIYGTKYTVTPMSQEFIDAALSNDRVPEMLLPGSNPFIPTNLQVINKVELTGVSDQIRDKELKADYEALVKLPRRPNLLKDTPKSRLWHKADDRFKVPRANVFVALKTPLLDSNARHSTLASLLCELFRDSIDEELYDIELASVQFSMEFSDNAIVVKVMGYNDRIADVTKRMLGMLRSFAVTPGRFDGIKDQLRRNWISTQFEEPHSLATYYAEYAQTERMYTPAEKLEVLSGKRSLRVVEAIHELIRTGCDHDIVIEMSEVQSFMDELFSEVSVETMIHGNIDSKTAIELQETIENVLQLQAVNPAKWVAKEVRLLPQDIANEPAFNVLRTKEQLGYLIWSGQRSTTGTTGFRILLQSEKSATFIESRIESFFDYLRDLLNDLTNDQFETIRAGFISKQSAMAQTLNDESSEYWSTMGDGHYDFERNIMDLFNKFIHPSSPGRRKLSIHLDTQYKGVKFDPQRAKPMIQAFMINQVPVPQQRLFTLLATQPGVAEMQAFARECLTEASGLTEENRTMLGAMISGLGGIVEMDDSAVAIRETNTVFTNIAAFKARLGVPRPL